MWVYLVPACGGGGVLLFLALLILLFEYESTIITIFYLLTFYTVATSIVRDLCAYEFNKEYLFRRLIFIGVCFLVFILEILQSLCSVDLNNFVPFHLSFKRFYQTIIVIAYIIVLCVFHAKEILEKEEADYYDELTPLWIFLLGLYTIIFIAIVANTPILNSWFENLMDEIFWYGNFKSILKNIIQLIIFYASFMWLNILLCITRCLRVRNSMALVFSSFFAVLCSLVFFNDSIGNVRFVYKNELRHFESSMDIVKYFLRDYDDIETFATLTIALLLIMIPNIIIGIINWKLDRDIW